MKPEKTPRTRTGGAKHSTTAYAAHLTTITTQIEELRLLLEHHSNQYYNDPCWGKVGDLEEIEARLDEVLSFLRSE